MQVRVSGQNTRSHPYSLIVEPEVFSLLAAGQYRIGIPLLRGRSSTGRAPVLQAGCRGFDFPRLQYLMPT